MVLILKMFVFVTTRRVLLAFHLATNATHGKRHNIKKKSIKFINGFKCLQCLRLYKSLLHCMQQTKFVHMFWTPKKENVLRANVNKCLTLARFRAASFCNSMTPAKELPKMSSYCCWSTTRLLSWWTCVCRSWYFSEGTSGCWLICSCGWWFGCCNICCTF